MTFRKLTRTVTAVSQPALEQLVAYWEGRQWQRTGHPAVEAAGQRRPLVWSQQMESAEVSGEAGDPVRGGRLAVVWFE